MTHSTLTIREFLRSLGLEHHAETFEAEHVSVADLVELDHADLKNHFGIQGFMDRKRILQAAGGAPSGSTSPREVFPLPLGSRGTPPGPGPVALPSMPGNPYGASVAWGVAPSPTTGGSSPAVQSPVLSSSPSVQFPPLLASGQSVGDFTVEAFLGRGGFGEVYRVRDPLGMPCALKVVQFLAGAELLEPRLWEEWNLVRRLDHSHLLVSERPQKIHVSGLDVLVFPMELAEGGSLRAWLQRTSGERADAGRLPGLQAEGVEAVRQVALGLASLHQGGKAHLDIKPENMLRQGQQWKLADFGLSRDVEHTRLVGSGGLPLSVGTGPYMSPEQVLAARLQDVGVEADVWGLGVVLFEVLDGHPPYAGDPARIREIIRDRTVRPSMRGVPQPYRSLVERCLSHTEGERPRAEEVAAQLDVLLQGKAPTENAGVVSVPTATPPPPVLKSNLVVDPLGTGDARTITEALAMATPDAVIQLKPGTYRERIELSGSVVLEGPDREGGATIESETGPVVHLSSGTPMIRNITIRNLTKNWFRDSLRMIMEGDYSSIDDNESGYEQENNYSTKDESRGILEDSGSILSAKTVEKLTQEPDSPVGSINGGALLISGGQPRIEGVDVSAPADAGISVQGGQTNALIRFSKIHGCELGISTNGGHSQMTEVDVFNNSDVGIEVRGEANPVVRFCNFYHNGGAGIIITDQATGTFEHCEVFDNSRESYSDGIGILLRDEANPTLKSCNFHHNGWEIGVTDKAKGTFEHCEVESDFETCIYLREEANPTVRFCDFYHSNRFPTSAGIHVTGKAKGTFEHCKSFNNDIGIFLDDEANPTVKSCNFHHNESQGIHITENAKGIFKHCEVSFNGDGIRLAGESNPTVSSCKFYDNKEEEEEEEEEEELSSRQGGHGIIILDRSKGRFGECESFRNEYGIYLTGNANATVISCNFYHNRNVGIVTRDYTNGTFERCNVFDNDWGILLQSNFTIESCNFYKNRGTGIHLMMDASGTLRNCKSHNNSRNFEKESSCRVTIISCKF